MTARQYECRVTHARTFPLRNVFTYRTYLWLVDLDDLPQAGFRARDHLGDPRRGSPRWSRARKAASSPSPGRSRGRSSRSTSHRYVP